MDVRDGAKYAPKPFGNVLGGPKGPRPLCYGCFCLGLGTADYKARINRMVSRGLPGLPGKECRIKPPKPGQLDPAAKLRWVQCR